jgi:hypothetical protein
MRALYRIVRRSIKPARLWINAWQYKRSEAVMCRERERQVRLAMRRTEIVRW